MQSPHGNVTVITYIKGDATRPVDTGGPRIICHVCNDLGKWGRGFVLALRERFPCAAAAYHLWHRGLDLHGAKMTWPKPFELGNISVVPQGSCLEKDRIHVANMIAQHGIYADRNGVPPIRYEALDSCLQQLCQTAISECASIHMPRIGCGLAGGEWSKVEALIISNLVEHNIDVYVYDFEGDAKSVVPWKK